MLYMEQNGIQMIDTIWVLCIFYILYSVVGSNVREVTRYYDVVTFSIHVIVYSLFIFFFSYVRVTP